MIFQFESLMDFLVMSGHGSYVWAAYLITITGFAYLCIAPLMAHRAMVKRELKKRSREEDASS